MKNADIEILGKVAYALGKYLPESEFGLFKDYLRVYELLKARDNKQKQRYQEKAEYHRRVTQKWREENPEKQKEHSRKH
jgi:tRNA A22 N-methylase